MTFYRKKPRSSMFSHFSCSYSLCEQTHLETYLGHNKSKEVTLNWRFVDICISTKYKLVCHRDFLRLFWVVLTGLLRYVILIYQVFSSLNESNESFCLLLTPLFNLFYVRNKLL